MYVTRKMNNEEQFKEKQLKELFNRYQIWTLYHDRGDDPLERVYWHYLFMMINTYLWSIHSDDYFFQELIIDACRINREEQYAKYAEGDIFSIKDNKGRLAYLDGDAGYFWEIVQKLERKKDIQIPSIIRKLHDRNSAVHDNHQSIFGEVIKLEDIEKMIKIADHVQVVAQYDPPQNRKKLPTVYKIPGHEEKRGIARASGNGAVLTVPKGWIGKEVCAVRRR